MMDGATIPLDGRQRRLIENTIITIKNLITAIEAFFQLLQDINEASQENKLTQRQIQIIEELGRQELPVEIYNAMRGITGFINNATAMMQSFLASGVPLANAFNEFFGAGDKTKDPGLMTAFLNDAPKWQLGIKLFINKYEETRTKEEAGTKEEVMPEQKITKSVDVIAAVIDEAEVGEAGAQATDEKNKAAVDSENRLMAAVKQRWDILENMRPTVDAFYEMLLSEEFRDRITDPDLKLGIANLLEAQKEIPRLYKYVNSQQEYVKAEVMYSIANNEVLSQRGVTGLMKLIQIYDNLIAFSSAVIEIMRRIGAGSTRTGHIISAAEDATMISESLRQIVTFLEAMLK